MRLLATLFLAAGFAVLSSATRADDKDNKKALKELEGTYLLIGLQTQGVKLGEDEIEKNIKKEEREVVIKGDQIISKAKKDDTPGTITVDASKTPHQINITSTKNGKQETGYGIYKLDNGVLTICAVETGDEKDRPKDFKAADKAMIITLKKQK